MEKKLNSCIWTFAILAFTFFPIYASDPGNGELNIDIEPSHISKTITVRAVSTVYGSKNDGYPITHEFDYLQKTGEAFWIQFVDDPGHASDPTIGYGRYLISIDGNNFYVDFRDCDYWQSEGGPYSCYNSDIVVIYNANTSKFRIASQPNSPNIWAKRCDGKHVTSCFPTLPPAPQNLAITNAGQIGQSPHLSWDSSSGADSYKVYRCTSHFQTCNWQVIGTTTSTSYTDYEVTITSENNADDEYSYYVTAVNAAGESQRSNIVSTWGESFQRWTETFEFASNTMALPKEFTLEQNHPNPFNPETEIRYALPRSGWVELVILNIAGQVVRRLAAAEQPPGTYRELWDGRDHTGRAVASGIYLCRLQVLPSDGSPPFVAVRKMALVR